MNIFILRTDNFKLVDNIKTAHMERNIMDRRVLDDLVKLTSLSPYEYRCNLSKLFGILLSDFDFNEYLCDINLLIALLACYHNEKVLAKKYIKKYIKSGRLNKRDAFIETAIISSICNKIDLDKFLEYMQVFGLNEYEKIRVKNTIKFLT